MFRTAARFLFPNRLDALCRKTARKNGKKILLAWNRGLGDIPLGLYAVVHRIRHYIPDAEITFLTRENLREGFSLLEGVQTIIAPDWVRGRPYNVKKTLRQIGCSRPFDLIIPWPNPTAWVSWQIGNLVPRLIWDSRHDDLWRQFDLPEDAELFGVQAASETDHGPWRNWPRDYWQELFGRLEKNGKRVILFGYGAAPAFLGNVIDLRGRTTLFEMLSIIKNRCRYLILPDSGILSIVYFLDISFPLRIVSLWSDRQGVLKQNVPSPNPLLVHQPIIDERRDLSLISVDAVWRRLCEMP